METRCGGLFFTSKFDSGNLARVEKVGKDDDEGDGGGSGHYYTGSEPKPDYEFNVWTKPDMGGTPFENGNRSWFYFGVKGGSPGRLIKINIVNMNRQGKLYNQGHSPIVKTVPGRPRFDRIRDRPTYETVDGQFVLSFSHRFLDAKGATTYFAFCYPWTYAESQNQMAQLDAKFEHCKNYTSQTSPDQIYYQRECVCLSLDKLRIDLLTISDCAGIQDKEEDRFDTKLFPEKDVPRCKKFANKRVYFLSSRVHPGETPASHVYNGFLEFILRPDDPRAKQLRRQYVFKLIPMLNPDGVMRGHYRTDARGVNLNRMYLDPDFTIYPSIYASKSLLVYHHVQNKVVQPSSNPKSTSSSSPRSQQQPSEIAPAKVSPCAGNQKQMRNNCGAYIAIHQDLPANDNDTINESTCILKDISEPLASLSLTSDQFDYDGYGTELASGGECQDSDGGGGEPHIGNEGSDDDDDECYHPRAGGPYAPHLSDPKLREIPPDKSGIAMYIDLHAHASKRGCFIYGNFFDEEEKHVDNMLFSKLASMNTAHFDFTGCNYTERNMYLKDKREGLSKEGAGRVALYKALGIIHSYTLECNYNTGRMVNSVPAAYGDNGRATPPPLAGFPPKYRPEHFEEVGRALAVAMLDMTESNPWSRIPLSEHCSLQGVREYVRRFIRGLRGLPRGAPHRPQRIAAVAAAAAQNWKQQNLYLVETAQCEGMVEVEAARYEQTLPTPSPSIRPVKTAGTQRASRGSAAASSSTSLGKSVSSSGPQKATPIPRVASLSNKGPVTSASSQSGGYRGGRRNTIPQAPPPAAVAARHRELAPVREGSAGTGVVSRSFPERRRRIASSNNLPHNAPPQSVQHSLSAPVPLTLTNSIGTDIKGLLSSDSGGLMTPAAPPDPPSRQTSLDMESIHSMEEEKVQQLKNLARTSMYARTAKPLDPPKSDPVKRRNKRAGGPGRRSSSHSPKSAKGGPRKLGSVMGGDNTDIGGGGGGGGGGGKTGGRRRKSVGNKASKHQHQQSLRHTTLHETPTESVDPTELAGSAVRITPRAAAAAAANGGVSSSLEGSGNGPPLLYPAPPGASLHPYTDNLLPTDNPTPTNNATNRQQTTTKRKTQKRGSRGRPAVEVKRDLDRLTAKLAEKRIQRVLQHHIQQQQQQMDGDNRGGSAKDPTAAYWLDF